MFHLAPLIIIFPLMGIVVNLTVGARMRPSLPGYTATTAALGAFGISLLLLVSLSEYPQGDVITLGEWLAVGNLSVAWSFQIDTLSVTMAAVVTGVGTLIHFYSIGYMDGDERYSRFFIYLNLFLVAMLILVLADNYLMMFVGWEGVGLCSFLLIGFWFDRDSGQGERNSRAASKAFIVNRIGDFGLLMSMFLIFRNVGSLNFAEVFENALDVFASGSATITLITLLMLLGITAKSAQIPLYLWLPDAMAGPTPASALIHAATMVTAGVYLLIRSHVLLELAPLTQSITISIGVTTAIFAALLALGQSDIKRVLAYSTISQLGFMVAAAGMGAYSAALFHLLTHAFFKALLFLAAGSVIHGMAHGAQHTGDTLLDIQDMRLMGGLRKRMPVTWLTYLVGALALVGIPPLAGFFSKDEILAYAYDHNPVVYLLLSCAVVLTALYIGRQMLLVFTGDAQTDAATHATESSRVMRIPMLALAGLTLVGGLINLPGRGWLSAWLSHTTGSTESEVFMAGVAITSTVLAILGLMFANWWNRAISANPVVNQLKRLDSRFDELVTSAFNALTSQVAEADHIVSNRFDILIIRSFNRITNRIAATDRLVLNRAEFLLSRAAEKSATQVARIQTGDLNWNVVAVVSGLLLVFVLFWAIKGA